MIWIDFAVDHASEFFIGASDGEFMARSEGGSFSDNETSEHKIIENE